MAVAGNAVLLVQKLMTPLRQQQRSEAACEGTELPLAGYLLQQEYVLTCRLAKEAELARRHRRAIASAASSRFQQPPSHAVQHQVA